MWVGHKQTEHGDFIAALKVLGHDKGLYAEFATTGLNSATLAEYTLREHMESELVLFVITNAMQSIL